MNQQQYGQAYGQTQNGHQANMKLKLSLKAKDLKNVAGAFKGISDPYAVVTIFSYKSHNPVVLGRTETVKNCLDPDWVKTFNLDYQMGANMNVVVSVLDEVSRGRNIEMGSASFEVTALLGATGSTMGVKLKKGGTIIARVDKQEGTGTLRLKMSGSNLKNVEDGFFAKSDPFFALLRKDYGKEGFEWNSVYRSNVVKNNLNPIWKEDTIELSDICGADLESPIILAVYDNEKDGNHTPMGQVETTVNGLVNSKQSSGFYLINTKGKKCGDLIVLTAELSGIEMDSLQSRMTGMSVGAGGPPPPSSLPAPSPQMQMPSTAPMPQTAPQVQVPAVPMVAAVPIPATFSAPPPPPPTFTDYVNGGCEIQLSVAIDYTSTNGNPRQPGTLHYLDPSGVKNDYEKVISAIGSVLANYDSDRKFPVWGFGAKFNGQLYNLFQCGTQTEVEGVPGILQAYRQAFSSGLVMSGPTSFTQVIDTASSFATKAQEGAKQEGKMKYGILLIITNGTVSNVGETLASLERASDAPLSIVVVGVGNNDFTAMNQLDDQRSYRDILQFVEFNAHKHDSNSLTQATLNEIPGQLVGYFQRNGINPPPAVVVPDAQIPVVPQQQDINMNFNFDPNGNISVAGDSGAYASYAPPSGY